MSQAWEKLVRHPPDLCGVLLSGDPTVMPTRWWNEWLIPLFWKQVTVLELPLAAAQRGYHLGFIPTGTDGIPRATRDVLRHRQIRVRHGREDCVFFATSRGEAIPLALEIRTHRDDPRYQDAPCL
jgi:hypothetical protein